MRSINLDVQRWQVWPSLCAAMTGLMGIFRQRLIAFLLMFAVVFLSAPKSHALNLNLSDLNLVACEQADPASKQPEGYRSGCYVLDGQINNSGKYLVKDVDVFAFIYDASGEAVLPNRPRIGSIKDVPPGESAFSVRVPIPSFADPPFTISKPKAKKAIPVPTPSKLDSEDDLLPLERTLGG